MKANLSVTNSCYLKRWFGWMKTLFEYLKICLKA